MLNSAMESEVFKTCRLCLNEIRDSAKFFCLDSEERNSKLIQRNLMDFLPEINLYLTSTSIICNDCSIAVDSVHKFKKKCLQTENHIRAYIATANDVTIPVDLTKFVQHLKQESIIVELDNIVTSKFTEAAKEARNEEENSAISLCGEENIAIQDNQQSTHLQFVDINSVMFNTDSVNYAFDVKEDPVNNSVTSQSKHSRLDNLITRWRKKIYYDCNICAYRTVFESNLNAHMKNHGGNIDSNHKQTARKANVFPTGKFFVCYNCGRKMSTKHGLTMHLKTHRKRELPCKFHACLFKATSELSLYSHSKIHKEYDVQIRTIIQNRQEHKEQRKSMAERIEDSDRGEHMVAEETVNNTTNTCELANKTNIVAITEDTDANEMGEVTESITEEKGYTGLIKDKYENTGEKRTNKNIEKVNSFEN